MQTARRLPANRKSVIPIVPLKGLTVDHIHDVPPDVPKYGRAEFRSLVENTIGAVHQIPRIFYRETGTPYQLKQVEAYFGRSSSGGPEAAGRNLLAAPHSNLSYLGVGLVDGGGDSVVERASAFAELGYPVVVLGDSDKLGEEKIHLMEAAGATVLLWDGGMSVEQRACLDLPLEALAELANVAVEKQGSEEAVRDAVAKRLGVPPAELPVSPSEWVRTLATRPVSITEPALRRAMGDAAKANGWFKRVDLGELLGAVIARHMDRIAATDLGKKLAALRGWCAAGD